MITLSPQLKAFVTSLETFVRKVGSWVVIVNNFTHSFHVTGAYGVNSVLTAIAGSLLFVDHQASKKPTA